MNLTVLRGMVRTCQMGEIVEALLENQGDEVGKVVTKVVKKNSKLYQKLPWLFKNVENPHIQYGYDSYGTSSFFLNILNGNSVQRTVKYQKADRIYHVNISGQTEHLNCVYDPSKPLLRLSRSAFRASSGVKGTPEKSVDILLNMNNSALRVEGRVDRSRLSGLESYIPSRGRISFQSGVEGTPEGRTDIGLNYNGTDASFEMQNSHIKRLGNFLGIK